MKNPIPRSALEHHLAFVGKTGSGKTGSAKSGIIEPALAAEERVCVIDPTGAWWGLRLDADGKSKGLPIYVFGGDHGDYPLSGTQGEMMAEAIGRSNTPVILDTTRLKTSERMKFFTDFADTILRVNQGPLRLVIDEAHLFAPQAGTRGSGAMPDMLHAANNLISLGRSRGLRIVLISQRPAKVHKDSLTQVESLVAMRLIAPQDRKAVEEWIADQADKETGKEIIASLPSLKNGEAWVWSPEAHFLKRVIFPLPKTYDSSKIQGTGKTTKRLSPIDLEKLQEKFAKVRTEAEAKDPKILQKRVAELEAQLRKTKTPTAAPAPAIDKGAIVAAENRGYIRGLNEAEAAYAAVGKPLSAMEAVLVKMRMHVDDHHIRIAGLITDAKESLKSGSPAVKQITADAPKRAPAAMRAARKPSPAASGDGSLSGAQLQTLGALAWWSMLGQDRPTRSQLGGVIGIAPSGSTMRGRLADLSSNSLIFYPEPNRVALTEAGRAAAPPPDIQGSLVETVRASLSPAERETFDALPADPDEAISREELGAKINVEPGGSTMRGRLANLAKRELIRYPAAGSVARQQWVVE